MNGQAPPGDSAKAVASSSDGEKKAVNSELWHACAGPLVSLSPARSLVVYFPQGHCEQVASSLQRGKNIPSYPNLPSKLVCLLQSISLHADIETDEVYAKMTLQPVNPYDKEAVLASDLSINTNKPQIVFFCKALTASDTSTHGGFSVPRRAAEKIFPPLDFTKQPPAQELKARDLHENVWNFRHIYRGQPKRHLLTTGWSLFVSAKRLVAGDSVIFVRDANSQLLVGIRRTNRQPANISSSVLSSDSMHIGILAAAAHAASNHSSFSLFYNPRASPSEFVIPLAMYNKAVYGNQISLGARFKMMFETEELEIRRYMGTIVCINDLDPIRWKNSQWRNLQVRWDECASDKGRDRVSIWEIELVMAPFFICPSPFLTLKRQRGSGKIDAETSEMENLFKRALPWLGEEVCLKDPESQNTVMSGMSLIQWLGMQQNPIANSILQPNFMQPLLDSSARNGGQTDMLKLSSLQGQYLQQNNMDVNAARLLLESQELNPPSHSSVQPSQSDQLYRTQHDLPDINSNLVSHPCLTNQILIQPSQPECLMENLVHLQQPLIRDHQLQQTNIHNPSQQQQLLLPQQLPQENEMPILLSDHGNQHQIQLHLLQKLQVRKTMQRPHAAHPQNEQLTPLEVSQPLANLQEHSISQQCLKSMHAIQLPQSSPDQSMSKLQCQQVMFSELPREPNSTLVAGNYFLADRVAQSGLPTNSTSTSANCADLSELKMLGSLHSSTLVPEEIPLLSPEILRSNSLVYLETRPNIAGNNRQGIKNYDKHSIAHHRECIQDSAASPTYICSRIQPEYLDSLSSTTSACLSQTDGILYENFSSLNQPSALRSEVLHSREVQVTGTRNNAQIYVNTESQTGTPFGTNLFPENTIDLGQLRRNMFSNNCSAKDVQQDVSSSVTSQSFGVPEMVFESTVNESCSLHQNSWAPAPQFQTMRTYTKVYKLGAVGRSIDVTCYSGYHELRRDLARMFSIDGQFEDGDMIGWKLVYVDHENDVLLVGDDPWEEFVNCVRYIRILSPQEVHRMSLDVDLESKFFPNQAGSSTDGESVL